MLTKNGCRSRLARLREGMTQDCDAILIHLPEHLLYLANFFPDPSSLNYNSSSFLLVEKDGKSTLFVDNWLSDPEDAAVDEVVVTDWYTGEGPARNRAEAVAETVVDRLEKLKVETIAAESNRVPLSIQLGRKVARTVVDVERDLRHLREIKDPDEIEAIQRGVRTAEAIHQASREFLRPGLSELEYYSALVERAIVAAGAPFVMMCDLASGPRAAAGGGPPTTRILQEGELVILDMFPYVAGYRGDITNTLVVGGEPNGEQQELFEIVLRGLKAAESLLRPGTPVREIFQTVDSLFRESAGNSDSDDRRLIHHAGHAIGLGHPEAPEIVPESDATLREGMVVTLEPGLYGIESGGIRLEHDYLITADGYRRLSDHTLGLS